MSENQIFQRNLSYCRVYFRSLGNTPSVYAVMRPWDQTLELRVRWSLTLTHFVKPSKCIDEQTNREFCWLKPTSDWMLWRSNPYEYIKTLNFCRTSTTKHRDIWLKQRKRRQIVLFNAHIVCCFHISLSCVLLIHVKWAKEVQCLPFLF